MERTLDELIEWLIKLRKSQEGNTMTNVTNITINDAGGMRARIIEVETKPVGTLRSYI